MKNILILIIALFFISGCGDKQTKLALQKEGYVNSSKFVNFPEKMKNCELYQIQYRNNYTQNLFTVVCPNSTVSTSYTEGKQQVNVIVSSNDQYNKESSVLELFKQKTSFLDNIKESTFSCQPIENSCKQNKDGGYHCSSENEYYNCSVKQSKIVDHQIVENSISMKCNSTECIL